jgi:hypothetical protein
MTLFSLSSGMLMCRGKRPFRWTLLWASSHLGSRAFEQAEQETGQRSALGNVGFLGRTGPQRVGAPRRRWWLYLAASDS